MFHFFGLFEKKEIQSADFSITIKDKLFYDFKYSNKENYEIIFTIIEQTKNKEYLIKEFYSEYIKIQNILLPRQFSKESILNNKNRIDNILYLGEDDSNYYYISSSNINNRIYTNDDLIKKVCFENNNYTNHLKLLIESDLLDNMIHRRVKKNDLHFIQTYQWFQESFCYGEYPKLYKNSNSNKTVIVAGTKYPNTHFYKNSEILSIIENNSSLCNENNQTQFVYNLLKSGLLNNRQTEINTKDFNYNYIEINSTKSLCNN